MSTAPPTDKKTATKTAYRVLKFPASPEPKVTADTEGYTGATAVTTPPGLQDVGEVEATTPANAIRALVDKHGAGTYVAVPARSWKPTKVTVETATVVKVGDA